MAFGGEAGIPVPASVLTCCVALAMLLSLSEPAFLPLCWRHRRGRGSLRAANKRRAVPGMS